MNRLLLLWLSVSLALPALAQMPVAAVRTVETRNATLRLNAESCDLVGLDWKAPALQIVAEPRLGENFRLLLPRPGYEAAYFNSRDQKVSRIEATADGVVCSYDSLRRDDEQLPVKVQYEIRAAGSQIQFSITVDNPTDRPLAEVYYGILGGLKGIGDRLDTQSLVPGVFSNWRRPCFTPSRPEATEAAISASVTTLRALPTPEPCRWAGWMFTT